MIEADTDILTKFSSIGTERLRPAGLYCQAELKQPRGKRGAEGFTASPIHKQ
jgi:hypothetical protein